MNARALPLLTRVRLVHGTAFRRVGFRQRQCFGDDERIGVERLGLHGRQLPQRQQLEQRVPEQLGFEQRQ
jgi:hypothetical protein